MFISMGETSEEPSSVLMHVKLHYIDVLCACLILDKPPSGELKCFQPV